MYFKIRPKIFLKLLTHCTCMRPTLLTHCTCIRPTIMAHSTFMRPFRMPHRTFIPGSNSVYLNTWLPGVYGAGRSRCQADSPARPAGLRGRLVHQGPARHQQVRLWLHQDGERGWRGILGLRLRPLHLRREVVGRRALAARQGTEGDPGGVAEGLGSWVGNERICWSFVRLLSKFSLSFSSPYNLQRYLLNMYLFRSWPRYNFNLKVNLYRLNIVLSGSCISLLPRAMMPLLHLYVGALVGIMCHHGCPVSRITEYKIVPNNQRFWTISCNPYWQCAICAGNMPIVLAICQSCWLSADPIVGCWVPVE